MPAHQFQTQAWLRSNWFFLAAAFVVLGDLNARSFIASARLLEATLLGDLAVVVPGLYFACYRRNGKKAVIRSLALVCLGIWAAAKLVPPESQHYISYLWPFRYAGMAALVILEAKVLFAAYRSVFKGATVEQATAELQEKTEMPAWVARLAALEANFWRRVIAAISRAFRGKSGQ